MKHIHTIILGAGAAGLMCAAHAGKTGKSVLVLDHAKAAGDKIRISGGGRCNFTNLHTTPQNFISNNKHFAKSALSRYTQHDFINLVKAHNIPFHEKTLGQLFCDTSAKDIIKMLLGEMEKVESRYQLQTHIKSISKTEQSFNVETEHEGKSKTLTCTNLVIATGGKSIPKMGATGFGYQVAEQFGMKLTETRPALVPFTLSQDMLAETVNMAGVAVNAVASCGKTQFDEAMLFTHRGLSGPSILQISSYWREGQSIKLNLAPTQDITNLLKTLRKTTGKRKLETVLADLLPKRLAAYILNQQKLHGNLADLNDKAITHLAHAINTWEITPLGTEGYRTAEVTLGGIDTSGLNSKTMETKSVEGLYFIGEVVDVTGWLGGYNFQWAWSSGWATGTAISAPYA